MFPTSPITPRQLLPTAYGKWGATGLKSINGEPWLPGRPLEARCSYVRHEADDAPHLGCTCGVYAAKSFESFEPLLAYTEYGVVGEVYLWGKVVEHERGYRAQFAYPKNLALPSNIALQRSRWEPLTVYGADISVAAGSKDQHIQLWTKGICCWCKQQHKPLQPGDSVIVIGRDIGLVERGDGPSCVGDRVCIRLPNNDLYIVPPWGVVWHCPTKRWEVDLRRFKGTVILRSLDDWKRSGNVSSRSKCPRRDS